MYIYSTEDDKLAYMLLCILNINRNTDSKKIEFLGANFLMFASVKGKINKALDNGYTKNTLEKFPYNPKAIVTSLVKKGKTKIANLGCKLALYSICLTSL